MPEILTCPKTGEFCLWESDCRGMRHCKRRTSADPPLPVPRSSEGQPCAERDGQRYTLDQAREILRKQECMTVGHNFETMIGYGGEPEALYCDRCDRGWNVRPQPEAPEGTDASPPSSS